MKTILYLISLTLITAVHSQPKSSCVAATKGLQSMHTETLTLTNDLGIPVQLKALIADDDFERASGFQYICPKVIDKTRILFRYNAPINAQFHMNNVYAPLDIAFFDGQGRLITTLLMATYTNISQPLYGPNAPFQYALEAPIGWLQSHNLTTNRSFIKFKK